MFKDMTDLSDYFHNYGHAEAREREYKSDMPWECLKYNITKAALAISNLQNGGFIIIGIDENKIGHPKYHLSGMSKEHAETYNQDDVSDFVNKYAEPHIDIELKKFFDKVRNIFFIIIQISEFKDIPIICKKSYPSVLTRGQIYIRSSRKIQSTSELTVSDMGELIERAIDKGIIKLQKRIRSFGNDVEQDPSEIIKIQFEQESEGF